MDIGNLLASGVLWLVQQPAVQGAAVAAVTEVVKKSPVGPTGGPGIRAVAAVLAIASAFASAAAAGDVKAVDPAVVGEHLTEALSAFLAAVGAWQLATKKPKPPAAEEPVINPS